MNDSKCFPLIVVTFRINSIHTFERAFVTSAFILQNIAIVVVVVVAVGVVVVGSIKP